MIAETILLEWESAFARREKIHSGPPPYEGYAGGAAGALHHCINEIRSQRDMLEKQEDLIQALLREKEGLEGQVKDLEAFRKAYKEAERKRAVDAEAAKAKQKKAIEGARKKEAAAIVRNTKEIVPKKDPFRS